MHRCELGGDVLVVDDNEPFRQLLSLRLKTIGCACHTAANPEAALHVLRTHASIGVVVVDYHMGSSDTGAFVRKLKKTCPSVTIVGNSSMPRAPEFAAMGVDHFLLKP